MTDEEKTNESTKNAAESDIGSTALLACPFCGSHARVEKYMDMGWAGCGEEHFYRAGCETIGCRGQIAFDLDNDTPEEATNRWNSRC